MVCCQFGSISYEPELFPGLIYRLVKPRVVFLIFVSGKVVLTGAKTEEDMKEAFTKMYPVLVEFQKQNIAAIPGTIVNNAVPTEGAVAAVANPGAMATNETSQREMEEV